MPQTAKGGLTVSYTDGKLEELTVRAIKTSENENDKGLTLSVTPEGEYTTAPLSDSGLNVPENDNNGYEITELSFSNSLKYGKRSIGMSAGLIPLSLAPEEQNDTFVTPNSGILGIDQFPTLGVNFSAEINSGVNNLTLSASYGKTKQVKNGFTADLGNFERAINGVVEEEIGRQLNFPFANFSNAINALGIQFAEDSFNTALNDLPDAALPFFVQNLQSLIPEDQELGFLLFQTEFVSALNGIRNIDVNDREGTIAAFANLNQSIANLPAFARGPLTGRIRDQFNQDVSQESIVQAVIDSGFANEVQQEILQAVPDTDLSRAFLTNAINADNGFVEENSFVLTDDAFIEFAASPEFGEYVLETIQARGQDGIGQISADYCYKGNDQSFCFGVSATHLNATQTESGREIQAENIVTASFSLSQEIYGADLFASGHVNASKNPYGLGLQQLDPEASNGFEPSSGRIGGGISVPVGNKTTLTATYSHEENIFAAAGVVAFKVNHKISDNFQISATYNNIRPEKQLLNDEASIFSGVEGESRFGIAAQFSF